MTPNITAAGQGGLPLPVSSTSASVQPLQDTPRASLQGKPEVIVNIRSTSVDIAAAEQAQPQGVAAGTVRSVEATGNVSATENALEQTAGRVANRLVEERGVDRRIDEQRELLADRSAEVLARTDVLKAPELTPEVKNRAAAGRDIASADVAAVATNRTPDNTPDIASRAANFEVAANQQAQANDISSVDAPVSETARLAQQNDMASRATAQDNREVSSRDITSASAASAETDRLAKQNNIASRSVAETGNRQAAARDLSSATVTATVQTDNNETNAVVSTDASSLQSPLPTNGLSAEAVSVRAPVATADSAQAVASENSVDKAVEMARKQSLAAFVEVASATGVVNNGGAGTNVDLHV